MKQLNVFKWSTLERRNGLGLLTLIPNEIYYEIFDYIRPSSLASVSEYKETWSRMALVCRFFCSVALPRIFETLTFDMQGGGQKLTKLCREIIRKMEPASSIAHYVKECVLRCPGQYKAAFLIVYTKAMTHMPNLESVTLHHTTLNAQHLSAISRIPSLASLFLSNSSVTDDMSILDFSATNLKSLEVLGCEYPRAFPSHLVLPPLSILKGDLAFIYDFLSGSSHPTIKELHLVMGMNHVAAVDTVYARIRDILQWCPSVARLSLVSLDMKINITIPSIFGELNSVQIQSLEFRNHRVALVEDMLEFINELGSNTQLSGSLREVRFTRSQALCATWTLDLPFQHEQIVSLVYKSVPHISSIQLEKIGWYRGGDGVWHLRDTEDACCDLTKEYFLIFECYAATNSLPFRDYDGFLARFLTSIGCEPAKYGL